MKHKVLKGVLWLILSIAIFFRFYNLDKWVFFGMDQEYEALLAKNIITGKHFPLIGVNASDTGLYLGPAFIYFAAIPFAIFKGNPLGWAFTASALGVIVTYLIYKIGKKMFSERAAIAAAFLYGGSYLVSYYDRQFWNPMFVSFFSLIIGYLLFLIIKGKTQKLILLGFIFGLAIQTHLSMLIFLPLIVLVIHHKRNNFRKIVIKKTLLIFFLTQLPIILFEIRHNFLNTRALLSLFLHSNNINISEFPFKLSILLSLFGRFLWLPSGPDMFVESGQCLELSYLKKIPYPEATILVLLGIAIFIWYLYIRHFNRKISLDILSHFFKSSSFIPFYILIATLTVIIFYRGKIFEYYFLYLFPWLAIILGVSIDYLLTRKHNHLLLVPVMSGFLLVNLLTLFTSTFNFSYQEKREAFQFIKKNLKSNRFQLEAVGECPRFGGYRYLTEYFISIPESSYMDPYFSWIYKDLISVSNKATVVLLSLIDHRDGKNSIRHWEEEKLRWLSEYQVQAEKRLRNIHVLILDK